MLLNSARSPIVLMEQITVDGVSTLKEHSAGLLTPTCSFWVYIQLTIDRWQKRKNAIIGRFKETLGAALSSEPADFDATLCQSNQAHRQICVCVGFSHWCAAYLAQQRPPYQPSFKNTFKRPNKTLLLVEKNCTILCGGSLGSWIDEEHSKLWDLAWIADTLMVDISNAYCGIEFFLGTTPVWGSVLICEAIAFLVSRSVTLLLKLRGKGSFELLALHTLLCVWCTNSEKRKCLSRAVHLLCPLEKKI